MPALAAARLDLVSTPEVVTWYSSLPQHAAPSDSFPCIAPDAPLPSPDFSPLA